MPRLNVRVECRCFGPPSGSRNTSKVAFAPRRDESRIAIYLVIHRGFGVPSEVCCNLAIVSVEREGYLNLRQRLSGVFGDAMTFRF